MAVTLPSDLIADVIQAADPAAARAAADRLAGARAANPARTVAFAALEAPPIAADRPAPRAAEAVGKDPRVAFEAMVLRSFTNLMMPTGADSAFGGGLAGDYWKSMLADQIADQIANSGGIGIARSMLKDFTRSGDSVEPIAGAHDAAAATGAGKTADLAAAMIADVERRSVITPALGLEPGDLSS